MRVMFVVFKLILSALETAILDVIEDQSEPTQAYSVLEEQLEALQSQLKEIED